MLDHPDAGDCIERLRLQLAIVLKPDLDAAVQAGVAQVRLAACHLFLAQRDTQHPDVEFPDGVGGQGAPPAADVQQALSRLEP